ncbi:hypothetical protein BH23VER1_BH23VER1_11220 [soil metagenome]
MSTPIDAFLFYTKMLTGLVIVLNFSSLVSIFLLTRWLKHPEKAVEIREGSALAELAARSGSAVSLDYRAPAKAILLTLLLGVVAVNGLAIFANANLLEATDQVVRLFSI